MTGESQIVKVAELNFVDNGSGQLFTANTPFVDYEIFEAQGGWCGEYRFGVSCVILTRQVGVTKEQAMKVCQDDFEFRVLKCISTNHINS